MGGMHFTPEDFALFIGIVGSVLGVYGRFKGEVILQEQRLTKIDKDIEYLKTFQTTATRRLDSHEEQNKSLLVMAEQIKTLSDDIKEIKTTIDKWEGQKND